VDSPQIRPESDVPGRRRNGAIALALLTIFMPRNIPQSLAPNFFVQMKLLSNRDLSMMYLLSATAFGGTFVIFTFLAPILTEVTGGSGKTLSICIGNLRCRNRRRQLRGRLADRQYRHIKDDDGDAYRSDRFPRARRHRDACEAVMLVALAIWGVFGFMQDGVVKSPVLSRLMLY
jgi:hypothetical protein